MDEDDPTSVSAANTDGLEQEVEDTFSTAEAVLLGIVATAITAEITGAVHERIQRLSAFRSKVTGYVRSLIRRGTRQADTAITEAARRGESTAEQAIAEVQARGQSNGAGRNSAGSTRWPGQSPSQGSGDYRPDRVPAPINLDGNAFPTGPSTPGPAPAPLPGNPTAPTPGPLPGSPQPSTPPADAPRHMSLNDLRKTAPMGPRTERGVTIRTPNALKPQLEAMAPQMIAAAEGIYQEITTAVLADPLASETQRLQLAQSMLNRFADRGITGYVDRSGRRWSMTTYVEMATRTAAAQTAIDAHVALLAAHGYDLVRVSIHANCSNLCQPFQGHLLSATGATSKEGPEHWRRRIVTTLADARTRGFNHPNCKHWVTIWVPGDALPVTPIVDPSHYKAEQHLRYLERQVRASKRRRAAAMTPEAATAANARTRALQQRIRDHVDSHPTVPRKRHREQIDTPR